jgi:hypothetical protein
MQAVYRGDDIPACPAHQRHPSARVTPTIVHLVGDELDGLEEVSVFEWD